MLAIGDGRADREALLRVTEERLEQGVRQKNLKYVTKPDIEILKAELINCTRLLEDMISHDMHLDISMNEENLGRSLKKLLEESLMIYRNRREISRREFLGVEQ